MKKFLNASQIYILDFIFIFLYFYILDNTNNIDNAISIVFGIFLGHLFLTRSIIRETEEKKYKTKNNKNDSNT